MADGEWINPQSIRFRSGQTETVEVIEPTIEDRLASLEAWKAGVERAVRALSERPIPPLEWGGSFGAPSEDDQKL